MHSAQSAGRCAVGQLEPRPGSSQLRGRSQEDLDWACLLYRSFRTRNETRDSVLRRGTCAALAWTNADDASARVVRAWTNADAGWRLHIKSRYESDLLDRHVKGRGELCSRPFQGVEHLPGLFVGCEALFIIRNSEITYSYAV